MTCNPSATHDPGFGPGTCGCPPQRYFFENGDCIFCHNTCLECTGSGELECTKCEPPLALQGTACSGTCPIKTYNEFGFCEACHDSCLECTGPAENNCLKCQDYYAYMDTGSTCKMCNDVSQLSNPKCLFTKKLELREDSTNPDFYSSNTLIVHFEG